MSATATASNSILQGLALDFIYGAPKIYDGNLAVSYPDNIYRTSPVYGVTTVQTTPVSLKTKSTSSTAKSAAPVSLPTSSDELLQRQRSLLQKVQQIHQEIAQLDGSLRKDKSTESKMKPAAPSSSSQPTLAERLKTLSNPTEIAEAIAAEEVKLLERIKALSQRIDQLSNNPSSASNIQIDSTFVLGQKESCTMPLPVELVIHASPRNPPLSLLVLAKGLQAAGKLKTATFVHSSVSNASEEQKTFLDGFSNVYLRYEAEFLLTLIWKEVGPDPILWVNPAKQNPIYAEANIARFVSRLFDKDYDSPAPQNLGKWELNNRWLNIGAKSLVNGNSKEKQSALRNLNSFLGKASFLAGNEPGLLDAVVLSALYQTDELKNLGANGKKWMVNCLMYSSFSEFGKFLNVTGKA